MSTTRFAPARRRPPAPADRYRAVARAAKRRRARRRLSPAFTGLVWGVVLLSAVLVPDTAAGGVARIAGSAGSFVTGIIPAPGPASDLTLVTHTTRPVPPPPTIPPPPPLPTHPSLPP